MENYFHLNMDRRAVNQISALGLAHCGDAVFELLVRSFLCASGKALNGNLHRATVDLVCAPAQAARAERMLPLLTEEELAFYKRGRNAHVHQVPKNATYAQYARSHGAGMPVWRVISHRPARPADRAFYPDHGGIPCHLTHFSSRRSVVSWRAV